MSCAACKNNDKKKENEGNKITFHRFPKHSERRVLWIKAVGRSNWNPSAKAVLCSVHFREEYFDRTSLCCTRLKENAVPEIFPNRETNEKEIGLQKRKLDLCTSESPRQKKFKDELKLKSNNLDALQNKLAASRRKVKALQRSKRRLKKQVANSKELLKALQRRKFISEEDYMFLNGLSKTSLCIVNRQMNKAKGKLPTGYDENLKAFAITLQFLSDKGYNFVRKTFDTCLPHPKTLSKWYQNVNAKPGICKEALEILKVINRERKYVWSLVFDGMSIKKYVEWDGQSFHGYVNIGVENDDDSAPVASQALVFHLVCINSSFKIPVAYFFTDSLSGKQQATLLRQCLINLHDSNVHVVSITCDGTATNMATLNLLGCNLYDPLNLKTMFSHPVTNEPVYAFLDACHMLKLVRNTLGDKHELASEDGLVQWEQIKSLLDLQDKEGLHLGNKLSKSHIYYHKQKMKVKLATQVLSRSVSDALEYCRENRISNFQHCTGTIIYLRNFNDLFDILNSRSIQHKYLKQALNKANCEHIIKKLGDIKKYIIQLKETNGYPLYLSSRKTGFVGFLVCIESTLELYKSLVDSNNAILKYIPLYKMSQDHVERLFSYIRSRNGHNNNPSARQFQAAFKRILVHKELSESSNGNALPLDKIKILNAFDTRKVNAEERINETMPHSKLSEASSEDEFVTLERDYILIPLLHAFSSISADIIEYIAGYIVRRLNSEIRCFQCTELLCGSPSNAFSLLTIKNRGGLVNPSSDVVRICTRAENLLRTSLTYTSKNNILNKLMSKFFSSCQHVSFFNSMESHFELYENHQLWLIEAIAKKYFNIRLRHNCKTFNNKIHFQKVRQHFTKLVLFKGQ